MREISGIFADENILPVGRRLAKLPEAGVRAVILTGRGDMTPNGIYDLILKHWDEIAAVDASRSGPCMFSLTTQGLRELPFVAPRRQTGALP